MTHFADRLIDQCRVKGSPVCVGIDPLYSRLPQSIREDRQLNDPDSSEVAADAIFEFSRQVLKVIAPHAAVVKFQSAYFERYGWDGVETCFSLIQEAKDLGLLVILDAKRGDIGETSAQYAAGLLADPTLEDMAGMVGPDALTVNSYLGIDGLQPFMDVAKAQGKGLFALVRTSNAGSDAIQSLVLQDGRTVAQAVAQLIAQAGGADVGVSGYSSLGAVVGATKPAELARLRELMPQQIFLVPGFGAQGGSAADVKACFKADGTGALIAASRSITYAFEKDPAGDWLKAIEQATIEMKQQINSVLGA